MTVINQNLQVNSSSTSSIHPRNTTGGSDVDNDFIRNAIHQITNNLSNDKTVRWRQEKDLLTYLTALSSNLPSDSPELPSIQAFAKDVAATHEKRSAELFPSWTQPLEELRRHIVPRDTDSKSLLNDPKFSKGITENSFAHILVETLINKSRFAGNNAHNVIEYLHQFLETYTPPFVVTKGFEDFKKAIALQYEFQQELGTSPSSSHYKATVTKYIAKLKVENDFLLIETGWIGDPSGHSTQQLIVYRGKNTFDEMTFNIGAGADKWHFHIFVDDRLFVQSYSKKEGVSKETLTSDYYLQVQYEMNWVLKNPLNTSPTDYTELDLYSLEKNKLDGVISSSPDPKNTMALQNSPICTWASIKAAMNYFTEPSIFNRTLYDIAFQSLCTFHQTIKEDLKDQEDNQILMEHAGISLAQITAECYRTGVISNEELEVTYDTLREYFQFIDAQVEIFSNKHTDPQYSHNPDHYIIKNLKIATIEEAGSDCINDFNLPKVVTIRPREDFQSPQAFLDKLGEIRKFINKCNKIDSTQPTSTSVWWVVVNTIRSLPLPTELMPDNTCFWDHFNEEEAKLAIIQLHAIVYNARDAFVSSDLYSAPMRKQLALYFFTCLMLCERLSKNIPEFKPLVGSLPLTYFLENYLHDIHTPFTEGHCTYYHPRDRKLRSVLLNYFHSTFKPTKKRQFFVSDELTRNSPPAYCHDIPLYKMEFEQWLQTDEAPAEAAVIHEYLKNEGIRLRLIESYPELENANDQKRFVYLMCATEAGILPDHFLAYRDIALQLRLLTTMVSMEEIKDDLSSDMEEDLNEDELDNRPKKYFEIEESDTSITIKLNYTVGEIEEENEKESKNCNIGFDAQNFNLREGIEYTKLYDMSRLPGLGDKLNDAKLLSNEVSEFLKLKINLPVELCADLMGLLTMGNRDNNKHHPETQIIRALSFFMTHRELLNEEGLRALFHILLLESDFLEVALMTYRPIGYKLSEFIAEGITHSYAQMDLIKFCFYVHLGSCLERIVNSQKQFASIPFPDFYRWLKRAIDISKDSIMVQCELRQMLLMEFINNQGLRNIPGVAVEIIKTYFLYKSISLEVEKSSFLISESSLLELTSVYSLLESFILQVLSDQQSANNFCNALLEELHGVKTTFEWNTSGYPFVYSEDNKYCLNFYTGECFINNRRNVVVDSTFLSTNATMKLFKKSSYNALMDTSNCYYIDVSPRKMFIYDSSCFLYFKEDNKPVITSMQLPSAEVFTPFNPYMEEETFWGCKLSDNKREFSIRNQDFIVSHLFLGREENDQCVIEKIYKISGKEQLEMVPLSSDEHPFKEHLPLEIAIRSVLWKNAAGIPVQLDIPFLSLSFTVEQTPKGYIAHCDQMEGYHLSDHIIIRNVGAIPLNVILEDAKGNRKALLAKGKIYFLIKGAFSREYDVSNKPRLKQEYYVYSVDPIKGIVATDKELKLNWAYHLTAQKKYFLAFEIIRKSISTLIPYTQNEVAILQKIGMLKSESEDPTPQSTAISLIAYILYCRTVETSKIDPLEKYTLKKLYLSYIENIYKAPQFKISPNEIEYASKLLNLAFIDYIPTLPTSFDYRSFISPNYVVPVPGSREKFDLTQNDFQGWCKKISPTLPENRLIIRPACYMQSNFLFFYDKAQNSNNEVLSDIAFAQNESSASPFLLLLLKFAHENPAVFPTTEMLAKLLHHSDWNGFQRLVLEPYRTRLHNPPATPNSTVIPEASTASSPEENLPTDCNASNSMQIIVPKRKAEVLDSPSTDPKIRKVELRKIKWIPFFSQKELNTLFVSKPKSEESLTPEQLEDALYSADVNIIPQESERIKEEISKYWNSADRKKPWNLIEGEKNLEDASRNVAIIKAEKIKRFNVALAELLLEIEKLPDQIKDAYLIGLERQGLKYRTPTLEELTIFIARKRSSNFQHFPPNILLQEENIRNKVIEVQSQHVRIQQLERAQKHLSTLQNFISRGITSEDISYRYTSESFYYELTRIPPYNPYEYPHLLCMEVLDSTGIYDWQHTDIDRIIHPHPDDSKNIVFQKNMGSGKTRVYLQILALLLASNGMVPFVIVHSSQSDSVAKVMENGVYSQAAVTFTFSRQSQSLAKLRNIAQLLEKAKELGGFFFVTDTTLYDLRQCYKETLVQYLQQKTPEKETEEKLRVFLQIDRFMSTKCPALWDEFDLLGNCRFENIYTTGEPIILSSSFRDLVADIFESIFSNPEICSQLKTKAYTEAEFHDIIKEKLIHTFIKSHSLVKEAVNGMMDDTQLHKFLMGDKEVEQSITNFPLDVRNLLHIVHDEFNTLFPLTESKQYNVDYMSSQDLNKIFPVPGLACKVPNPTSDFGFIFALLNYTLHTLIAEGVTPKLLQQLIRRMQTSAREEQTQDPSLRLEQTKGFQDFTELCGSGFHIPFFNINSSHINNLIATLPKDIKYLCSFAKRFIFPLVTYYPQTIVSTPYSLIGMFPRDIGLTATPWNNATYHESIKTIFDPTVEPLTTGLLIKNSQVVEIDDIADDENGPENTIKALSEIEKTKNIPFDDLIDSGAFIKIEKNIDGAKLLLKYLPPTKRGVVFYHNNVEMVLERCEPEPILVPLEKCRLPLNQRHIFFDDWHTTGANIDADPLSCGYLTYDKTSKRKLGQSFGRKRQRHLRQRVIIIIKKSQGIYIRNLLQLEPGTVIQPKHILKVSQYITETEINEQLVGSAQSKLDYIVEEKLLTTIRDSKEDPLPLLRTGRAQIIPLITKKVKLVPAKMMGPVNQEIDKNKHFNRYISRICKNVHPLSQNCPLFKDLAPSLKATLDDTLSKCAVPQPIPRSHFSRAQQLVQQQTQQQSQAQVRQEVSSNSYSSQYKNRYYGHWNWNSRNPPSSGNYFINRTLEEALTTAPKDSVPILKVNHLMGLHDHLIPYAEAFKDIEMSINFTPEFGLLFEKRQYKAKCVLLILERSTQSRRLILLNEADRGFFFGTLNRDAFYFHSKKMESPYEIALYDFGLNIIQVNHYKEFNVRAFDKELLITRFMYGEMLYNKNELEILKAWIIENGVERMERFFYQHVLYAQDTLRDSYPGSTLHKLFISLLESEQVEPEKNKGKGKEIEK
ncbi:MAG: DUF3638 domain-containing protein [Parachlamydiales bacterium]|jgi:hypothetical protein